MEKYIIAKRNYSRKKQIENSLPIRMYIVEIRCDTADDIPEAAPWWDIGSSCFIVKTQEIKFLNSQGEWE